MAADSPSAAPAHPRHRHRPRQQRPRLRHPYPAAHLRTNLVGGGHDLSPRRRTHGTPPPGNCPAVQLPTREDRQRAIDTHAISTALPSHECDYGFIFGLISMRSFALIGVQIKTTMRVTDVDVFGELRSRVPKIGRSTVRRRPWLPSPTGQPPGGMRKASR